MTTDQPVDLLIRGGLTLTIDSERRVFPNGYVAVADGKIVDVGDNADCRVTARETLDASRFIVMPGFVNAHDHLIAGFTRGLGGAGAVNVGGTYRDFPSSRIREAMDDEACYLGSRLSLVELQKSGVTTTTDSQSALTGKENNIDGTLRAITESRIRALFSRASMNRTEFIPPHRHDSLDHAIPELERLTARWASDRVEIAAEAQALHRVEEDLLRGLKDWTRTKGVHFIMHISYSQDAANHAVERFGRPLITLLDEWGVLDGHFLGFHPVWLNDDEIATLARTQAGVSYCPVDNMLIACGAAPVRKLQDAGVRLGTGIDQPNDGHNFFELLKLGILLQRITHLDPDFGSPESALELGTLGSARALHREHLIGSLERGKAADIVLLDAKKPELGPYPGRISNIVLAAHPGVVDSVFIGGEAVVRNGKHLIWDEEEVVESADRAMRAVAQRAEIPLHPVTSWSTVAK